MLVRNDTFMTRAWSSSAGPARDAALIVAQQEAGFDAGLSHPKRPLTLLPKGVKRPRSLVV